MIDDLLESRVAVDWSESQFEILDQRIKVWQDSQPYKIVIEFDPERLKNAIRYEIANPLPLIINAEVGTIINSIRTSLDILVVTLARRNGIIEQEKLTKIYFPISKSAAKFTKEDLKKINSISDRDKTTICELAPYKGGNDLLYTLHDLQPVLKVMGRAIACGWDGRGGAA